MEIGEGSGGADPTRRLPSPSEFLENLHRLIEDPSTNDVIQRKERDHFVISNPYAFILQKYATRFLGLSDFGLFIRCLYTCGLKKTEKDSFEYGWDPVKCMKDRFPDDEPLQFPTNNISFLFTKVSRISSFVIKLYDMVNNEATNEIISWSVPPIGENFVIWDKGMFCTKVLPRYLSDGVSFTAFDKHLENCEFEKKGTHDLPEYAHPHFRKEDRQSVIRLGENIKKIEGSLGEITELEKAIGGRRIEGIEVPAILPSPSVFLESFYKLADDTNKVVSWLFNGPDCHVIINEPETFILNRYPSTHLGVPDFGIFLRCLYSCGFKKTDTSAFQYFNAQFGKGNKQLVQSLEFTEFPQDEPDQFPADIPEIFEHQNVPKFINRIYHMVGEEKTNEIISWNDDGESFSIWDPTLLSEKILGRYSIEPNLVFFIRQLHSHGFVKKWGLFHQYSHSKFHRDNSQLLSHINLARAPQERARQIKRRKLYNKRRVEQFLARARARNRQHQDDDEIGGSVDESGGSN